MGVVSLTNICYVMYGSYYANKESVGFKSIDWQTTSSLHVFKIFVDIDVAIDINQKV